MGPVAALGRKMLNGKYAKESTGQWLGSILHKQVGPGLDQEQVFGLGGNILKNYGTHKGLKLSPSDIRLMLANTYCYYAYLGGQRADPRQIRSRGWDLGRNILEAQGSELDRPQLGELVGEKLAAIRRQFNDLDLVEAEVIRWAACLYYSYERHGGSYLSDGPLLERPIVS